MQWARTDFNWPGIEPVAKGQFNWNPFDQIVATAVAEGIKLLPNLSYSPQWANGHAGTMFYPPLNPQDYADFCGAVAARYYPDVTHFELWNEPNIPTFWQPAPDAPYYASLLQAGYAAIKAVAPGATVLMGGLAPAANTTSYLQAVYSAIGKDYLDAANYHPYQWNQTELAALRQVMINNGDAAKKLWLTELGIPTNGTSGQDFVSEAEQANILAQAVADVRELPGAGPLFIYEYKDGIQNQPDREGYFGIIRADGSQKPSWTAIKNAL